MMTDYIAYARVSTAKQGRSGLGLEAQEEAIRSYLRDGDNILQPVFVEVESGKRNDRPELAKALHKAKLTGATLLVAKLDRLARNTRFLLSLTDSGVDVVFCDLPQLPAGPVGRFMLTQMAAVAELEAGLISQRTKAALAAAKERGTKLGGFRGHKVDPSLGLAKRQADAGEFADRVAGEITSIKAEGVTGLRSIAQRLNERGIRTRRGGRWSAMQVQRVWERMVGPASPRD